MFISPPCLLVGLGRKLRRLSLPQYSKARLPLARPPTVFYDSFHRLTLMLLMVISPAKTLDFGGEPYPTFTLPDQLDDSQQLVDQLQTFSPAELSKLMKISDKLADLNQQRYQDFQRPFTPDNARQALFAFKGDVYKGIEVDAYDEADLAFAQQHLRILSGLYGILRPLDLIQPYRLEMGTKLTNDRGKNLYDFWGTQIAERIDADLNQGQNPIRQNPKAYLINLASNEYAKAIDRNALKANVLNIAFKENKAGTYKVIGIHAKRARGLMVDYVIKHRIDTLEPLQGFDTEGYCFNAALSTDQEWVFCRG